MAATFGQASVATTQLFALTPTTAIQPATISPIFERLDQLIGRMPSRSTQQSLRQTGETVPQLPARSRATSAGPVGAVIDVQGYDRPTTALEQLVGELRRYQFIHENWDGEGAFAPMASSLQQAIAFARRLETGELPEPMLLASGHAGLFWETNQLYADLEFLGDKRIAYFVKRNGDKHKGVLSQTTNEMPAVLAALLHV